MFVAKPPAAIAAAIKARPKDVVPQDKLDRINELARQARDKKLELEAVREKSTALGAQILEIEHHTLPDLMTEVRIKNLTLAAEGNYPAYDLRLKPYYRASISASWPDEQREKAFEYLREQGVADIIKTVFVVELGRDNAKLTERVRKALDKLGVGYHTEEAVAWSTLTAWLKECIEKRGETPDLATIGGSVGNIVVIKPLKEKM